MIEKGKTAVVEGSSIRRVTARAAEHVIGAGKENKGGDAQAMAT